MHLQRNMPRESIIDIASSRRLTLYVTRADLSPVAQNLVLSHHESHRAPFAMPERIFTMKPNLQKKPPMKIEINPQEVENEIRCRAFEIYEERGQEDGHDLDDWLRAEDEIIRNKARSIAA
jgi:hypothetical protein